MTSLRLQTEADYTINEQCTFDTRDHEDHTFCGIMFGIECQRILPLKFVEIQQIWVRGELGPLTVWTTPDTYIGKHEREPEWSCIYEKFHDPSHEALVPMDLQPPLRVRPGEKLGLYVHSKLLGDRALVYDNQKSSVTYHDRFIKVTPGIAHKSCVPFSGRGMQWSAWRARREFVGRMNFGVKYLLWTPLVTSQFPRSFNRMARTMLLCQKRDSGLDRLPTETILYILNMCRYDWRADLESDEDVQEPEEEEEQEEAGEAIPLGGLLQLLAMMPQHHVAQLTASGQLPLQLVQMMAMMPVLQAPGGNNGEREIDGHGDGEDQGDDDGIVVEMAFED